MSKSKRILTMIMVLAIMAGVMAPAALADSELAYGAATVTAAVLNIRSGAGTSGAIVGTVTKDSIVVVLERTNDDWYKINYHGTVGYVSTEYLAYLVTAANFTAKGIVNANGTRVRKGPGTSYDQLATCSFGESVDVIGINNGWYKVITNASVTGYIRSDLMSITGSTGSTVGSTVTPTTPNTPSTTPSTGTLTGGVSNDTGITGDGSTQYEGVVWGWGVRFRKGPGTEHEFTTSLNPGAKLTIIGVEGDWYKCIYDGVVGYVTTQYVTVDKDSGTPANPATGKMGTVNGSSVRFRTGPGTSYSVIDSLAKGTEVTVLGTEDNWYKCNVSGKTGYISKNYVTVAGDTTGGNNGTTGGTTGTLGGGTTTTTSGTGKVNCTALRMRSGPGTSNSTITTLSKGTSVTIIGSSDGWLKVTANGKTGWVSGEYISLTESDSTQTGRVTGTGVRFRTGPGTSYSIICTMPINASVVVYEKTDNWYKISYNGQMGYISASYVSIGTSGGTTGGNPNGENGGNAGTTDPGNATKGEEIARYACQFDGYRYVYGEETPSRGFDCSGLVYYVYKTVYGYSVHRTASTQYRYDGDYVTKSNLQPGDLVFFSSDGSGVTHVGIYVGSGKFGEGTFIHASTSKTGVKFDDLNSSYYKRVYYGAKRIV